jgi:hypothetical protein
MRSRTAKHSILATASAVALSVAVVMTARPLGASEFSDFRIPENRWYSIGASAQLIGGTFRDQSAFFSERSSSADGHFGFGAVWALDADDRVYTLRAAGVVGAGSRSRDRSEDLSAFFPPGFAGRNVEESDDDLRSDAWFAQIEARQYPFAVPLAFGIGGQAQIGNQHQDEEVFASHVFGDAGSVSETRLDRESNALHYEHFLTGFASIGWGRVRNATGVFEALLLERRLRHDGAITRALSAQARGRIAALYYLRPRFGVAHDRPDRFFWREVERVLRDDGALEGDALSAFDLFRVAEGYIAPAAATSRFTGLYLGGIVQIVGARLFDRATVRARNRIFLDDTLTSDFTVEESIRTGGAREDIRVGGEARLELPLSERWQVSAAGSLVTPPRDFGESIFGSSEASATCFVADRWGVSGRAAYRRIIREPSSIGRVAEWGTAYGGEVQFYAEDRLTLRLGIQAGEQSIRYAQFRDYSRALGFYFDVGYGFGGLRAPGLIEPVRSLSVSGSERGW